MPCLNEEASVEDAVCRMLASLERMTEEFEIIVINDGSTDRTGEIADQTAAQDARIRVLHNERNLNYGICLRLGIQNARCDWILHNGMDLPLAPEDVEKLAVHFDEADVVVACRTSRAAHSTWRKLTSWVNNRLLHLLFSPRTDDLNFTQCYRRSFVQSLKLVSTSPAFVTPEIIIRAERTGRRVCQERVEFRKREAGKPHFGKIRDIAWTLRDMFRLRLTTFIRGWN